MSRAPPPPRPRQLSPRPRPSRFQPLSPAPSPPSAPTPSLARAPEAAPLPPAQYTTCLWGRCPTDVPTAVVGTDVPHREGEGGVDEGSGTVAADLGKASNSPVSLSPQKEDRGRADEEGGGPQGRDPGLTLGAGGGGLRRVTHSPAASRLRPRPGGVETRGLPRPRLGRVSSGPGRRAAEEEGVSRQARALQAATAEPGLWRRSGRRDPAAHHSLGDPAHPGVRSGRPHTNLRQCLGAPCARVVSNAR